MSGATPGAVPPANDRPIVTHPVECAMPRPLSRLIPRLMSRPSALLAAVWLLCAGVTTALAGPITYTFTAVADAGSVFGPTGSAFIGTSASGQFTFDTDLIINGDEILAPPDLAIQISVLGFDFTAANDVDYSDFPQLGFAGGVPAFLDMILAAGVNGVDFADPRLFSVRLDANDPLEPGTGGVDFTTRLVIETIPTPPTLVLVGLGLAAFRAARWCPREIASGDR